MREAIDAARGLLEARVEEIDVEAAKLRSALESLGTGGAPRPSGLAGKPAPRTRRRGAKRAPRGQRREQFLAVVKDSPGASAAEIGKKIGISTNQAYALGQRLLKGGEVKKQGRGYRSA